MKKIKAICLVSMTLLAACAKTEEPPFEITDGAFSEETSEVSDAKDTAELSALDNFLNGLGEEYDLPREYKNFSEIILFDYDKDGVTDALFEAYCGTGLTYFIINDIKNPRLEYSFGAFEQCGLFRDISERTVIKYISCYGLNTYAAAETNFIFWGEDIRETKHVHFSGTSAPEEFYIVENGEKITVTAEELDRAIMETESSLSEFAEIENIGSLAKL